MAEKASGDRRYWANINNRIITASANSTAMVRLAFPIKGFKADFICIN
jgi:hypothetical protein